MTEETAELLRLFGYLRRSMESLLEHTEHAPSIEMIERMRSSIVSYILRMHLENEPNDN